MLLTWLRDRKRREITAEAFPDAWLSVLRRNVPQFAWLTTLEQARLQDDLRIFIAEKSWEGCRGLVLTDEMRVTVAGYAMLIALKQAHDYYPNVESILIYPASYVVPGRQTFGPFGTVTETNDHRAGEAWSSDLPIVISWTDALEGARHTDDGYNIVIHEFTHKLDGRDGSSNGVPPLDSGPTAPSYERWEQVMSARYNQLVALSHSGIHSVLNPYGATNAAEFFAVSTECFFERPAILAEALPDLYALLRDYYGFDFAKRAPAE